MRIISRKISFIAILILSSFMLIHNLPAPYWPCDGKQVGDRCSYGYGCSNNGACISNKDCTDDPATKVNECMTCKTRK